MKKHLFAKTVAVLGVIVSALYLLLLLTSRFMELPFEVSQNVLFADWAFIVVPILGFASSIALQIASVRNR